MESMPLYVNVDQIAECLVIDKTLAKVVLARYRDQYRNDGLKLLNKFTIPTMYLIKKLSEDTFESEEALIKKFEKFQ